MRYADDFLVLCPTPQRAQEARTLVQGVLDRLGLELSPGKTQATTYGKGYEFLGFLLSSRSRRMREKSVRKFKEKVRMLTKRHHNLDASAVAELNRVIRVCRIVPQYHERQLHQGSPGERPSRR